MVGRTILDIDDDVNYNFGLEDLITTHLPENILALGDLSGIKIKHLLYHTSGLNRIDYQPGTVEEIISKVLAKKRLGKPGQYYLYNNSGYILLGEVIKFVTKSDSWEGEVKKRLNQSLGSNSFIFPEAGNPNWLATEDTIWREGQEGVLLEGNETLSTGYQGNFTSVINLSGADIAHAAGSVIGNIIDANHWMRDLATNESGLLSNEYFQKQVIETHYADDYISHLTWNMGPGLGFEQNENVLFHSGIITGYYCMSTYSKNEQVTITSCLNGTGNLTDFNYEVLNEIYPYRKVNNVKK
jgi:CubicO group peptidase (beta-lactamase class C family)